MSELDYAMEQQMAYIVLSIGRPFSFKDFLCFEVDGKEHKPKYGTVRNKFLAFRKKGIIEYNYNSGIAFYSLKGYKFVKPVTPYPYGGLPFFYGAYLNSLNISENDPLYKTIANLPFGAESIHDIRSRFQVLDIYKTLSNPNNFKLLSTRFNLVRNTRSQDILVPSFSKDNAIVRIIVHKTDVVSVIIGCSKQPIPLDPIGLIRFSNLLTRAEERLQSILDYQYYHYNQTTCFPSAVVSPLSPTAVKVKVVPIKIPDYLSWLITMWHFGRDALVEYNGEKFTRTIEDAQHILTRIYSKEWGNGRGKRKFTRIRGETQGYPNITVEDALEEQLNNQNGKLAIVVW